jgi:energy-coupling factor transporter ATP-binding protein EcfA2
MAVIKRYVSVGTLATIMLQTNSARLAAAVDDPHLHYLIPGVALHGESCSRDVTGMLRVEFACGPPTLTLDPNTDTLTVRFPEQSFYPLDLPYLALGLLARVLQRKGHFLLHAAAVERRRRGILLVGPSGSGKTTLSLEMARRHDSRLIATEMTLVRFSGSDISILSGTHLVALHPSSRCLSADIAGGRRKDEGGKVILTTQELGVQALVPSDGLKLDLIVNLHGGEELSLRCCSHAERIIRSTALLSEWVRGGRSASISAGKIYPNLDDEKGMSVREKAVLVMSRVLQFSLYGSWQRTAADYIASTAR